MIRLTEKQYESLKALTTLLQHLEAINKCAIISNQYYDTVAEYKISKAATESYDARWQPFYSVESIVMVKR